MSTRLRLDVWLDVACLCKTRSEAQRACALGRVELNGSTAKPHRDVHVGDRIVISRPGGVRRIVVVEGLADRHIVKDDARRLYRDETPAPTPEELEARRIDRLIRTQSLIGPSGRPDKRSRRELRRIRGRDG